MLNPAVRYFFQKMFRYRHKTAAIGLSKGAHYRSPNVFQSPFVNTFTVKKKKKMVPGLIKVYLQNN